MVTMSSFHRAHVCMLNMYVYALLGIKYTLGLFNGLIGVQDCGGGEKLRSEEMHSEQLNCIYFLHDQHLR